MERQYKSGQQSRGLSDSGWILQETKTKKTALRWLNGWLMNRSGSFNVEDDLLWRYVSRCQHANPGNAILGMQSWEYNLGGSRGQHRTTNHQLLVSSPGTSCPISLHCKTTSQIESSGTNWRNIWPDDQSHPVTYRAGPASQLLLRFHAQALALYLLLQACIPGQYTEKHSSLHLLLPRNIHKKSHSAWITTPQIMMRLFRSSVE